MSKRNIENVGIFTYDLFPYMTAHCISGWTKNGDAIIEGNCTRTSNSLIAVFPKEQGTLVGDALNLAVVELSVKKKTIEIELLEKLYKAFPALKKVEKIT